MDGGEILAQLLQHSLSAVICAPVVPMVGVILLVEYHYAFFKFFTQHGGVVQVAHAPFVKSVKELFHPVPVVIYARGDVFSHNGGLGGIKYKQEGNIPFIAVSLYIFDHVCKGFVKFGILGFHV